MGRMTFEELEKFNQQNSNSNSGNREKFFSLSDNGDSAIVRILHTNIDNFDILMTHDVEVNGVKKRINCLRDAQAPTANCPLCAKGNRPNGRIFIHMLQYTKDATGAITKEHVVFDRGYSYAAVLKTLVLDYCTERPLYDHVFKITRNGAKGSKDTTYSFSIMPQFTTITHPYTEEDLQYSEVLGTIVWNKSAEDINTFFTTGSFPKSGGAPAAASASVTPTPNQSGAVSGGVYPSGIIRRV